MIEQFKEWVSTQIDNKLTEKLEIKSTLEIVSWVLVWSIGSSNAPNKNKEAIINGYGIAICVKEIKIKINLCYSSYIKQPLSQEPKRAQMRVERLYLAVIAEITIV